MNNKLYLVTIVSKAVVAANSIDQVKSILPHTPLQDIVSTPDWHTLEINQIESPDKIPSYWESVHPYSDDDNDWRLCEEYFNNEEEMELLQ